MYWVRLTQTNNLPIHVNLGLVLHMVRYDNGGTPHTVLKFNDGHLTSVLETPEQIRDRIVH